MLGGLATLEPRQLARALAVELRFRWNTDRQLVAARELRECRSPADYFRFAKDNIPGPSAYGSGSSQIEEEILPMLAFVAESQPRTVVEIGTQSGGTTFLLGALLPTVELVVGIDLFVMNRARLHAFARPTLAVQLLNGNSASPTVIRRLESVLGERRIDLLFIDGDHAFAGVAADFRHYRHLVRPGGLIAFHDIVPDEALRTGAPSEAWAGEVPILWDVLRRHFISHEFVRSWDQAGCGIGVLEHDPGVMPQLGPVR